jgi:hypothetical protein
MRRIAFSVSFEDEHIRLLIDGSAADLSFDGAHALAILAKGRPDFGDFVMRHNCEILSSLIDSADGGSQVKTNEIFESVCQALISVVQIKEIDIAPLFEVFQRVINDPEIMELIEDLVNVVIVWINSGGIGEPFVGLLLDVLEQDQAEDWMVEFSYIFTAFITKNRDSAERYVERILALVVKLLNHENADEGERCSLAILLSSLIQTGLLPDDYVKMAGERAREMLPIGDDCFVAAIMLFGSLAIVDEQWMHVFYNKKLIQEWAKYIKRGAFCTRDLRILSIFILQKIHDPGGKLVPFIRGLIMKEFRYEPLLPDKFEMPIASHVSEIPDFVE